MGLHEGRFIKPGRPPRRSSACALLATTQLPAIQALVLMPTRPLPPHPPAASDGDDEELLEDRGRGLGLRLLALLGALSFLMLGISSMAPLFTPAPSPPPPDQRRGPTA